MADCVSYLLSPLSVMQAAGRYALHCNGKFSRDWYMISKAAMEHELPGLFISISFTAAVQILGKLALYLESLGHNDLFGA